MDIFLQALLAFIFLGTCAFANYTLIVFWNDIFKNKKNKKK